MTKLRYKLGIAAAIIGTLLSTNNLVYAGALDANDTEVISQQEEENTEESTVESVSEAAEGSSEDVKSKEEEKSGSDLETVLQASREEDSNLVEVQASGLEEGASYVAAVWGQENGQNDLHWYNLQDGSFTFDLSEHKEIGTYFIHLYENDNGKMEFVTSSEYAADAILEDEIQCEKGQLGHVTIKVKNANERRNMVIAVWSEANAQKDLQWISMQKGEDSFWADVDLSEFQGYGTYLVHAYSEGSFIAASEFEVEEPSLEEISLENIDNTKGTAQIQLNGIKSDTQIKEISAAVWSETDQSNMHWYSLSYSEDEGSAAVQVDLKNHKSLSGNYNIHIYFKDANGTMFFAGQTQAELERNASIEITNDDRRGSISISLPKEFVPTAQGVSAALWSSKNGQDDLTWTRLNFQEEENSFAGEISYDKLKDSGECYLHLYTTGKDSSFISAKTLYVDLSSYKNVSADAVETSADTDLGTFSISVQGIYAPQGVAKVKAAVWSKENGQDDLAWYTLSEGEKGNYEYQGNIKNHAYSSGTYYIHIYITDRSGKQYFLEEKEIEFEKNNGSISISKDGESQDGDSYTVLLKNLKIPGGIEDVNAAIWSEEGGQDDLKWYGASLNEEGYQVQFKIADLKHTGKVIIHFYANGKDGTSYFLGQYESLKIEDPGCKLELQQEKEGKEKISVSELSCPYGIYKVKAAVWSLENDQDDLIWYDLEEREESYEYTFSIEDHKFDQGNYRCDIYMQLKNGKMIYLNSSETSISYESSEEAQYDGSFKYLAIGNSITKHAVTDKWWNEIGMAASDESHDYFHQVLAGMQKKKESVGAFAKNFAYWERCSEGREKALATLDDVVDPDLDLITVMLGENVSSLNGFEEDFTELIRYLKEKAPKAEIIVVGDFWYMAGRDEIKQRVAQSEGVQYISLSEIKEKSEYRSKIGDIVYDAEGGAHTITDPDVASHPNDKGMQYIAEKILSAM